MELNSSKSTKPFDYVAEMKNMNEASRKNKVAQLRWSNHYEWLCDEYLKVEEEMKKLCEEKNAANRDPDVQKDDRSIKPVPETTNGLYGWLAAKREFNLERYGSYTNGYPNPMDEITLLPGNIPFIAAGKGLI